MASEGSSSGIVAIKVSLWVLPFEALGLYVGTFFAVSPSPKSSRELPGRLASVVSIVSE